MTVRTRYAPSPTGEPHLGNIRTALFDWLLARHYGGQFILRIEDTDQARYIEGAIEGQMEALRWLGLEWDEGPDIGGPHGPYIQSQRRDLYERYSEQLIGDHNAYLCYCPPERLDEVRKAQQVRKEPPRYDRQCRELSPAQRQAHEASATRPVVRFKTPFDGETVTHDELRGTVTFQNATLDDFVLLKSDGFPTYHLASIVDDHLMEITHVLRGEEWLSSAPRHVLLYRAFGWEPPLFAHLSRVLGPDRGKLSKRHGAHAALEYREQGYLPAAVINFMALLGWSLDDHTEIIDRESLVKHFDLDRALTNPAMFNAEKLTWMNGVYIREMSVEALTDAVQPFLEKELERSVDRSVLLRIVPLVQERIKLLTEIVDMADFFFVDGELDYPVETLLGKKYSNEAARAAGALRQVLERIETIEEWEHETLETAVRPLADEMGIKTGDLFGLIRVAATGKSATPPLFETMAILGRETTLGRLRSALNRLSTP